jgi:hypothetical protein
MRSLDEIRKEKNDNIVARVKLGLSVAAYSPQDTWFQPRPIIKKDRDALDFGSMKKKGAMCDTPKTEDISATIISLAPKEC